MSRDPPRDRHGMILAGDHPLWEAPTPLPGDCISDVPATVKDDLARYFRRMEPDDTALPGGLTLMAARGAGLVDFAGAPHGGALKLLPEWDSQPWITPTTIIDHTIVGTGLGAYYYFRDRTGIEAHFIVHGRWGTVGDGVIWQLMSIDRQADANLDANRFAISIETEDDGTPEDTPWTAAQVESLLWLHGELRRMRPSIKQQRVTSCTSGGLAYHAIWGAPSCYTPSTGKTCPARARIDQWTRLLLPAFLGGDADMPLTDNDVPIIAKAVKAVMGVGDHMATVQFGQLNNDQAYVILDKELDTANAKLDVLAGKVDALSAKVDAVAAGQPGSAVSVDAAAVAAALAADPNFQAAIRAIPAEAAREAGQRLQQEPPA